MQPTDKNVLLDHESPRVTSHESRVDLTWLTWLGELVAVHGAGEYVLRVRSDGSVTVKRPRKPLEFDYRVKS